MSQLKLNQKAPDFTLESTTGEKYKFSNMIKESGEDWQLLVFFRGSWSPGCMEELKQFEEEKGDFEEQRIRLTAISYDSRRDLEDMMEEHGFTFPVLVDEDMNFLKAYDVHFPGEDASSEEHGEHGEPAYFLMDTEGKLLYQQRQTSSFGRPHPKELREIIQYIRKNLGQ